MKKFLLVLTSILTLSLLFMMPRSVYAESDSNASNSDRGSYIYDYWGNVMASAPAYKYQRELSYLDLGVSSNSIFSSVYYHDDKIYIADEGLNGIYVVNYDFSSPQKYYEFENIGSDGVAFLDHFSKPQGITVDGNGNIYIADTGNSRVLVFSSSFELQKVINKPDHLSLEGLVFNPLDVAVSYTGRIYVVGENVTYGIMELDSEGNFLNFIGTNTVSVSAMELFYRSIMTKEQRDYASLILPQQFRSIDVDDDGFIYCTSLTNVYPIKRLNFEGTNVLVQNGYHEVVGDIHSSTSSEFISVSANDKGIYMALDRTKYRIFVYNCDGEMIYMLGGNDRVDGYFQQPTDITWMKNDDIAVCDANKAAVIIFSATDFGKTVNEASRYHYDGDYENAQEYWEKAQKLNSNYDLAYVGIGKTYLFTNDYKNAMKYFKLGNNKTYYSKAYSKYTRIFIEDHFGFFVAGVLIIIGACFTPKIVKTIKKKKEEKK